MCPIDSEGYVCTPDPIDPSVAGARGVRLIATDDDDLMVQNWTWTATYRFKTVNGTTPAIATHSFALPTGATVDLTTVVKVPASQGIGLAQAEAAALRAEEWAATAVPVATEAMEPAETVVARADAGEFKGEDGKPGLNGSNVLPTDEAIAQAIDTPASATSTSLKAMVAEQVGVVVPPFVGLEDVVAKLDMRSNQTVRVFSNGDSTMDGEDRLRYYDLAWKQLAAELWPERKTLWYSRWAAGPATDGSYDPPVTWQEAALPAAVFRDTFTRSGDLAGSTPDVASGKWAGSAGQITLDGSKAKLTGTAYAGQVPVNAHSGADFTLANLTLTLASNAPTAVSVTTRIQPAYVDNANALALVFVNRGGAMTPSLGIKAANSERLVNWPALTVPSGNATNTITVSASLSGNTLTGTINGVSLTATLTGAELAAVSTFTKVGLYTDDPAFTLDGLELSAKSGISGLAPLEIYNAAVPGTRADQNINRLPNTYPRRPDVLFFGHGHNYDAALGVDGFIEAVETFFAAFDALWPGVPVVVLSENPQFAPQANAQLMIERMIAIKSLASRKGWLYIGTLEAIAAKPDGGKSLINADGLHPEPAGSQAQADEIKRVIKDMSARNGVV